MRTLKDSMVVAPAPAVRQPLSVVGFCVRTAVIEKQKYTCCKNGVVEPLLSCGT